MHKDCCHRKGGVDKRVGDAVRNMKEWDGKQSLDDFTQANNTLPTYSEAAGPAYSDAVGADAGGQQKAEKEG